MQQLRLASRQLLIPWKGEAVTDAVMKLQAEMQDMPQIEIPVEHTFAPGLYIRSITIPAGTLAVGKNHREASIFILSKGVMLLRTPEGSKQIEAPYQAITPPGKKAVYALTECVVANVHITELRDLTALEERFIVPDPAAELEGQKCLG